MLLSVLPCVLHVCLTSVGPSVHGLQRDAIILYLYGQTLHNTIYYCSLEFSLSYVCVSVCMDLTLSLGDVIAFCSPLCGVVCCV